MALKASPHLRVCGVIQARSVDELREAALKAKAGIVEFRLDSLPTITPSTVRDVGGVVGEVRATGRRVIVTLRDEGEGGRFRGSPGEKARILLGVAEYNPDYVDVEIANPAFRELAGALLSTGVGLIASHHRLNDRMSVDQILSLTSMVDSLAGEAGARGRTVAKVVYACKHPSDELPALQAVASAPGILVSFAVGEGCVLSRIAAPILGAPFTYAHEHGGPAAPGQLSVEEVLTVWRLMGVA